MSATMMSHGNKYFIFLLIAFAREFSHLLGRHIHIGIVSLRVANVSSAHTQTVRMSRTKRKKISSPPEVHTCDDGGRVDDHRSLAIVHARHGNNCIKCRRPTENMWTEMTTTTERPLVPTGPSQPQQRNKTKSKMIGFSFRCYLCKLIAMEFYGNDVNEKRKKMYTAVSWKGPWPLGVRKRNGKIVFFFE